MVCQVDGYQNILKLSCSPFAFTLYKAFLKNKKGSGTSLPASVSVRFLKNNIFLVYILLPDKVSLSGCFYFVRYRAICVLQLFVNLVVTS